jgi:hypothetical protein
VAKGWTAHGTRPGGATRGDARRVGGIGGFTPFGGDYLQVDGNVRTRRQEERVRVAARGEAPELAGVGSQKGLVDGTEAVDEKILRVSVV